MTDPPIGTAVLRQWNTTAVLRELRARPRDALRIAELAELTGLTRPTVSQAIDGLTAAGWVGTATDDGAERAPGRPAARYRLRPRTLPVAGIDSGPHQVSVGIADLTGEALATVRRELPPRSRTPVGVDVIDAALDECLAQAALDADDLVEVVVGSPGIIDPARGTVHLAPSVPGWAGGSLLAHLRARLACDLHLENDANLAALDAAARFPGETLVVVQWGERLGAGIVIGGRLHAGAGGAAGEIGFISAPGKVSGADETGQGPLERDIGARGIVTLARRAASAHPASELARLSAGEVTPTAVFRAAGRGDDVATTVVATIADRFADAVAPVILALNPHAVVIGGGLARAGAVLLDALRPRIAARTLSAPRLELSERAERAVVSGAMLLAGERAWRRHVAPPPVPGGPDHSGQRARRAAADG